MDLLMLLQKEGHIALSLSKVFKLPVIDGSHDLNTFLAQFEAAIDSDFPNYQVCVSLYLCTMLHR